MAVPKFGGLAALIAMLMVVVVGCGGSGSADTSEATSSSEPPANPVKIRMGWGIPSENIKYVMMKYPEVAPNLGKWYDIDWQELAGTPLGVQGLAAGTLDCATVGGLTVANGLDQGAKITLLGEFMEERQPYFSTTYMVRKDSGINSLEDLKGKLLTVNAVGSSTALIQQAYIKEQTGMEPGKDYKEVEVPHGQATEALLSGRVALAHFPQPFYAMIQATGEVKPMFQVTDAIDPFVQLLNGCSTEFVESNEVTVQKFQEDWKTVAQWIADPANRQKVIKADSTYTDIPIDLLKQFMLTKDDFYRPKDGAINVKALQGEWDFFHKEGAIKNEYKVEDFLSPLSVTDTDDTGS